MDDRRNVKDNMEEHILRVAEDMFLHNGYNGVSTTDIAKKVGCNQALIHYYFRTKSNLFKRVFENKVSKVIDKVRVNIDKQLSFDERVRQLIEIHFDFLNENPQLSLFLLEESRNNAEAIEIMKRSFFDNSSLILRNTQDSLDKEFEAGRITERIDAFDLLLDIISLNVFPFLAYPVIKNVVGLSEQEMNDVLKRRKEEVVRVIMNRLRYKTVY